MCNTHAIHKHMNNSRQKQLAYCIMKLRQELWSCSRLSAF